jgi:glyoxylase-like metal-dependent hydrolase (beta-lactamase superfamily II)
MELKEIAKDIYACLQEDKGFGWNNAGFVNRGKGLAIDTFWDLTHTREMMALYREKGPMPPRYLVNTHHNGDHVWGNQLFEGAEIIGHPNCAEAMKKVADPTALMKFFKDAPPELKWFADDISVYDFSGITITPPTRLIEDRLDLDLNGSPCHIIYVGPAHTSSDLIVHLPNDGILFAGDVLFNGCTPLGWEGTTAKWLEAIDFVVSLKPEVIVPGHGPLCGVDAAMTMRAYLEYVYDQARQGFDRGLSAFETAKSIPIDPPYSDWTEPERLIWNVYRVYREFRNEPIDTPYGDRVTLVSQGYELRNYWDSRKSI